MKKLNKYLLIILLMPWAMNAFAQDDLMNLIEEKDNIVRPVTGTFKGTRIINGHSVETRGKGTLVALFMHRFGTLNSGAYNLWGLDEAWIKLGLEYAITDDLMVAAGRSSFEKTFDGHIKYRFLKQKKNGFPFTTTGFAAIAINSLKPADPEQEVKFSSRVSYTYQVFVARKFTPNLSLQLAPTLVHHNLVKTRNENNDIFAIGFAGRYLITRRMGVTVEYYLQINNNTPEENYDSFGVGLELETGGHVFQLVFTNSNASVEKSFITQTQDNFFDGDIRFGFNITRAFQFKKKDKPVH